jgi:hypothetical protein
MKKKIETVNLLSYLCLLLVIAFGLATIVATGGGGGGSGTSGATGAVAVVLTDDPTDAYDKIIIYVTEVSLLPAPGYGPDPVIIFHCPEGYPVNLLDYRTKDFFLTRTENVPAWQYDKVRLRVKKIESDPPCDASEGWKLPSNKIDLNPRAPFEVKSGETLLIRLDVDAPKSIHTHPADEKCMFRPVVFVDIEAVMLPQPCPLFLTGIISEPIERGANDVIEAFTLEFPDRPGALPVQLTPETVIFLDDGSAGDASDLAEGQTVWVRGRLDMDGRLQAYQTIIGDIFKLKGTVESSVDGGSFSLLPDDETIPVDVMVSDESLVFFGCDTAASGEDIQPVLRAEVIAKDSQGDLVAIFVLLQPQEVSGLLIAAEPADSGTVFVGKDLYLTIQPETGDPKTIFFPKYTPIYLEGDGEVPVNFLCEGRRLRVFLDPVKPELTAIEVRIEPEIVEGAVLNHISNQDERTLLLQLEAQVEPLIVHAQDGTTILELRGDANALVDFDEIEIFDQVRCYGLYACPDDPYFSDFFAFVILIVKPEAQ